MNKVKESIVFEQKQLRGKIKNLVKEVNAETDWVKARAMYDEMIIYAKRVADLDTELKAIALIEARNKRKGLWGRLFKRTD